MDQLSFQKAHLKFRLTVEKFVKAFRISLKIMSQLPNIKIYQNSMHFITKLAINNLSLCDIIYKPHHRYRQVKKIKVNKVLPHQPTFRCSFLNFFSS